MKKMRFIVPSVVFACLFICFNILPYSLQGQTKLITRVYLVADLADNDNHWLGAEIYDPFLYYENKQSPDKIIRVFIDASEELFPEEVDNLNKYILFSGNHSYEWVKADTVAVPGPEDELTYVARLSVNNPNDGEYINNWGFDQKDNTLHVAIQYPDPDNENGDWITEIWDLDVHYTKPQVEFLEIMGGEHDGDPIILEDPESLELNLRVFRDYDGGHPPTNIQALDGRRKGGDWVEMWAAGNPQQGVPVHTIYFENILETLEIDQVQTGYTTFEFRSVGVCHNCANGEYSEVISFDVFYMEINLGDDVPYVDGTAQVGHFDRFYELEANPPGGIFSGPGVVENTMFFNPVDAGIGIHTIHYHFPAENDTLGPTEMSIQVLDMVHEFKLRGVQEVCRGSRHFYEFISNDSNLIDSIEIVGGSIETHPDGLEVLWEGDEGALDDQYEDQVGKLFFGDYELLVDIAQARLPEKPKLDLVNDELLICSDANALRYKWFVNNDLIGHSEVPYYLIPIDVNLNSGDMLHVEITNVEGFFPCFIASDHLTYAPDDLSKAETSHINAYPNPCSDYVNIVFNIDDKIQRVELIDMHGRVRYVKDIGGTAGSFGIRLHCGIHEPGIYVIRASGKRGSHVRKIYIQD